MKKKKLLKIRTKAYHYALNKYPKWKFQDRVLFVDGYVDGYLKAKKKYNK